MDSPKSEKMDTRYSTPVSELHDHRLPPSSHPVNAPASPIQERVSRTGTHPAATTTPVARDFEQAIVDDDYAVEPDSQSALLSPASPNAARRASRRVTHRIPEDHEGSSSSSERSSSPPDSIDAFAEPRRRERANTVGSRHPSELEEIQRTVSGGTHRRRPTFDQPNVNPTAVFAENLRQSPEPTEGEKSGRIPRIDYEILEEFAAESRRGRTLGPTRKKYSFSAQGRQAPNGPLQIPKLTRHSPSPAGRVAPTTLSQSSDEKTAAAHSSEPTLAQRPSKDHEDRFTFFSTEIEKAIHAPDLPGLLDNGERFRDMFELIGEEGAWWLDVTNPTKEELEVFEKAFGVHRLTTEDIAEKETREKVELFQTYYFVCFRSYNPDDGSEDYLEPINLYLVVFREGILSFAYSPNPHAAGVRQRIGNRKDTESLTADWICYAMV
jgi:magnesium transporter